MHATCPKYLVSFCVIIRVIFYKMYKILMEILSWRYLWSAVTSEELWWRHHPCGRKEQFWNFGELLGVPKVSVRKKTFVRCAGLEPRIFILATQRSVRLILHRFNPLGFLSSSTEFISWDLNVLGGILFAYPSSVQNLIHWTNSHAV